MNGYGDRAMQKWNCWQKGGLWPGAVYKVLTCSFKNQHRRIPSQPLDHTHPVCSPRVSWWRTGLKLQTEESLLIQQWVKWGCTFSHPGFGSLGHPCLSVTLTWIWQSSAVGSGHMCFGVCEYMTKQVQVSSSCLCAGKVSSLIFMFNTLPQKPSGDKSWQRLLGLGSRAQVWWSGSQVLFSALIQL